MTYDKLLVLDMDETLLYSVSPGSLHRTLGPPDFEGVYDTYWRPYVHAFLDEALESYREVAIWTAGTLSYALPLVEALGVKDRLSFVWGRERCTSRWDREDDQHTFLKPLKKLLRRGYRKEQVLVVDDTPAKLKRSYGNLVPIRPFLGESDDKDLLYLMRYLHELGPVPNVRPLEKRGWWKKYLDEGAS